MNISRSDNVSYLNRVGIKLKEKKAIRRAKFIFDTLNSSHFANMRVLVKHFFAWAQLQVPKKKNEKGHYNFVRIIIYDKTKQDCYKMAKTATLNRRT